jgi:phenylacetate-coenzyme A ligase PaaK-like adenylate-forming protein
MNTMAFEKLNALLELEPYGLDRMEKKARFDEAIQEVTLHHYHSCLPYKRLCNNRQFSPYESYAVEELPYLPTSIFKDASILSVPEEAIIRNIKSSATSTGRPSVVGLDKDTNKRQIKCFNKVVTDRIGRNRYKFVILDEPASIGRGNVVSARSSTIRSLLFCSKEAHTCLIGEGAKLRLDASKLDALLKEAEELKEEIIIFGFTYILYRHVVLPLLEAGKKYQLGRSKVIHIGGWKKLEAEKVTSEKLIEDCYAVFGTAPENVMDFYGFTEQSGLVYPTCEAGYRHTPVWVEIIVRDPLSLKSLPHGEHGLLQFVTPIQTSYPGHSVLTEDVGYTHSVDNCVCGRKGSNFKMVGRSADAEIRGCGDIMGDSF